MPVMSRSQPVIAGNYLQSGGAARCSAGNGFLGKSCTSIRDPAENSSHRRYAQYFVFMNLRENPIPSPYTGSMWDHIKPFFNSFPHNTSAAIELKLTPFNTGRLWPAGFSAHVEMALGSLHAGTILRPARHGRTGRLVSIRGQWFSQSFIGRLQ